MPGKDIIDPKVGWYAKADIVNGTIQSIKEKKENDSYLEIAEAKKNGDGSYNITLKDKTGIIKSDKKITSSFNPEEIKTQQEEINKLIEDSKTLLGYEKNTAPSTSTPTVVNRDKNNFVQSKDYKKSADFDDQATTQAKSIILQMLLLKGDSITQKNLSKKLEDQLLEIYDECNRKENIYNFFNREVKVKINNNKIDDKYTTTIKTKFNNVVNAKGPAKNGAMRTALDGNEEFLWHINNVAQGKSPKTPASDKLFTYTPKPAPDPKPAPVAAPAALAPKTTTATDPVVPSSKTTAAKTTAVVKLRTPALKSNRLIAYATRQGKDKNAINKDAFDAKTGFNMEIICNKALDAIQKAKEENNSDRGTDLHPISTRLSITKPITTKEQRASDDSLKKKLFQDVNFGIKTGSDPKSDPKKDNTFEIKTAGKTVITTELKQTPATTSPTAGAKKTTPEEHLYIKTDCSYINYEPYYNAKFDTTKDDVAKCQASVAGALPKLIAKTADIIGADSADVYIESGTPPKPMAEAAYTDDDLEKLIITAATTFSAHVYPIIDKNVWEKAKTYGNNIKDHPELKKMFTALNVALGTAIKDDNYNDAIKTFVTAFSKDTDYEKASGRDMKFRT